MFLPTMATRALHVAAVLLWVIACSSSPATPLPLEFTTADVFISFEEDGGRVSVTARREHDPDVCPRAVEVATSLNGADLGRQTAGGGYREDGQLMCDELGIGEAFDADTTHVEVGIELDQEDAEVRRWSVAAEWDPIATKVWTDDDVYQAAKTGEPFTVRWLPEEARAPEVHAKSVSLIDLSSEEIPLEQLERAPGSSRYRFTGELPLAFHVFARDSEHPRASRCEGFGGCRVEVRSYFELRDRKVSAR